MSDISTSTFDRDDWDDTSRKRDLYKVGALAGAGGVAGVAVAHESASAQTTYVDDVTTAVNGVQTAVDVAVPIAIGIFGISIVMYGVKRVFYS